jgi:transcriptional regulator with XRE-family HTH domain
MNLKAYLAETGTSQAELARRAGVTRQQVCHWAAGDNIPTLSAALRIAVATGGLVSVSDWPSTRRRKNRVAAR